MYLSAYTTAVQLNYKMRLPPGHLGLFIPLNQKAKKGVTLLAGMRESDYQEEIGLLLHNKRKEGRLCLEPKGLTGIPLILPH